MAPTLDGGSASGTPTSTTALPTTQEIISISQQQMADDAGVMFPPDELVPYVNLAIAEIIRVDPRAYPVTKDVSLVPGARQPLTNEELAILDVICNVSANGTIGPAPTILPRSSLDTLLPDWQSFTAQKTVVNVIRDAIDKYTFYVFPPQPVSTDQKLKMILSELPDPIENVDDDFPLDDSYKLPCIDYVIYLALHEETTVPNALVKANQSLVSFYRKMGVQPPEAGAKAQEQGGQQ